jgi:hypothetical protein
MKRTWPVFFWATAVALGALQAWTYRNTINSDGVAYLDLADAYLRGDWHAALSPYWSPLYPALLAAAMALVRPAPQSEFALMHVVNFCLYLGALSAFEYFVSGFIVYRQRHQPQPADSSVAPLPDWVLRAVGYMLFIWTSLDWISLGSTTPDMCLPVVVFAATGILLRAHSAPLPARALMYGITLGVGYLARAAMLPLGLVFIAAGALTTPRAKDRVVRAGVGLIGFAVISLLFIGAISSANGRPTAGDVGPLNYAWFVNGVPLFAHWEGEGGETPLHPPRRVLDSPPVYEFKEPIGGTFPLWFNPAYWHAGLHPQVNLPQQAARLVRATNAYLRILLNGSGHLGRSGNWMLGLCALLLCGRVQTLSRLSSFAFILLPAVAALGLFWLVYVEPRYIAPFVVVLILGIMAALQVSTTVGAGFVRGVVAATGAVWFSCLLSLTQQMVSDALKGTAENPAWEVATQLGKMGVHEGSRVAILGDSFVAYWARPARVRIVGDMPQWYLDRFWDGDPATRQRVIAALATSGAQLAVADRAPGWATTEGWFRIGDTPQYGHWLSQRDEH